MTKRQVAAKLDYAMRTAAVLGLWAAVPLALVVLRMGWRNSTTKQFDYMLAAELLLVVVLAFEGVVAISELHEAKKRARLEALLSIYNFSREIHAVAFDNPKLWRAIGICESGNWNDEELRAVRYAQHFCNLIYLEFEAAKLNYIDEDQWEADSVEGILDPKMREFLLKHDRFYPKDFRDWFKRVFKNYPHAAGGYRPAN